MLAQWDTRGLPAALLAPESSSSALGPGPDSLWAPIDSLAQMRARKRMEDQKSGNSTVAIPQQMNDIELAWTRALK